MFRKQSRGTDKKTHSGAKFLLCMIIAAGAIVLWGPSIYANYTTRQIRYNGEKVPTVQLPKRDTAIVFGAALKDKGTNPSAFLLIRVKAAVALYEAGRVNRILMSGDGRQPNHDEPYIMQREAIKLGVPAEAIMMDKFGFDTYDSCYRARHVREITSAIVVTQGYHLPRAVMTCQKNGIDTIGLDAPTRISTRNMGWYMLREWLSTDKLFMQLALRKL
ncbi:MAG TPA: ElyC/SanA/YdcF family protein [Candidatus Saccharibacteria bacterium]|nr:ElyC/SanA/YdcF family protein [Candidatus Saccharibacteria bacterium]